jgi:cell division protein FtsZ
MLDFSEECGSLLIDRIQIPRNLNAYYYGFCEHLKDALAEMFADVDYRYLLIPLRISNHEAVQRVFNQYRKRLPKKVFHFQTPYISKAWGASIAILYSMKWYDFMSIFPDQQQIPLKIISVGNAGCTVVEKLLEGGLSPDDCVMIGCCLQSSRESRCPRKIDLVERVSVKGFDCANDPVWCHEAAIASADIIKEHLLGSALNLIVAGMGGGIGTIAAPVIADISTELRALTIAVISKPFPFEGNRRLNKALAGIDKMSRTADMTILILYDRLQHMLPSGTTVRGALKIASRTLKNCIKDLHYWAIHPSGGIDGGFETKKVFLQKAGPGLSYIGFGVGKNLKEAMETAISCPLLGENTLPIAGKILVIINAVSETSLAEINESLDLLTGAIRNDETSIAFDVVLGDDIGVFLLAAVIN